MRIATQLQDYNKTYLAMRRVSSIENSSEAWISGSNLKYGLCTSFC